MRSTAMMPSQLAESGPSALEATTGAWWNEHGSERQRVNRKVNPKSLGTASEGRARATCCRLTRTRQCTGAVADPVSTRGHVVGPHTADVVIEAWGQTPAACFEEAVAGFIAIFADVTDAGGGDQLRFDVGPGSRPDLVVLLLEEVLVNLEVLGVVPRVSHVELLDDSRLTGTFTTVPVERVEVVGSIPKGVSYHGVVFEDHDGGWRCRATVDV